MPLLPLKKRSTPETTDVAQEEQQEAKPGAKNRPTPKRTDARAARGQVARTPAATKDTRAGSREERRAQAAEQRQAMLSGDVNKMPAYHRAPERAYTRELVDKRRNIGPLFLPVAVISLLMSQVRVPAVQLAGALALYIMMTILVIDSLLLTRHVSKHVAEKFPRSKVPVKMYAFQRSIMPKRWRMPRPPGHELKSRTR